MAKKKTGRSSLAAASSRQVSEAKYDYAAVYFLSLTVGNVRCFGEEPQTLDLSDGDGRPARWTVLLGDNGTGKTTLLQLMAKYVISRNICALKDASPVRLGFGNSSMVRYGSETKARMRVELRTGGKLTDAGSATQSEAYTMILISGPSVKRHGGRPDSRIQPMLACAYGAWRSLGASSLADTRDQLGVENLFADTEPLRNAEEWLLQLDYAASKKSAIQARKKEELQRVKALLVELLPDVDSIRISVPSDEHPSPYVEFKTPYGWVPLRQLGYGYQTLVAWMVDFASRMVEAYPASSNPLAEPAVVLVDEIDLHLHPRWQREIMGYLAKRFPNTQFIATAHSPLIVQAAADANIAVLRREGDRVVIDNDVKTVQGWRIDQVLTSDLFGVPSARPPQLDHALQRRKELLTKGKLAKKDKEELAKLEAQIGEFPTGETTAQTVREAELLEQTYRLLKKHTGQST